MLRFCAPLLPLLLPAGQGRADQLLDATVPSEGGTALNGGRTYRERGAGGPWAAASVLALLSLACPHCCCALPVRGRGPPPGANTVQLKASLFALCVLPPAGELLGANANLVLDLARPFAEEPTLENLFGLIELRPGQDVGCAVGGACRGRRTACG